MPQVEERTWNWKNVSLFPAGNYFLVGFCGTADMHKEGRKTKREEISWTKPQKWKASRHLERTVGSPI